MKRYEFSDWDLVFGSPVRRTYGPTRYFFAKWCAPLSKRISIEWDGRNRITAKTRCLWPSWRSWSLQELGGLSFGIREEVERPRDSAPIHHGWFWFVHLNGKQTGSTPGGRVLAEFVVGHQHDRPATDIGRASVPPRVQDLVSWLESCAQRRAHGPVLVVDKGPAQRTVLAAQRR